jgi:hypothetical protein
VFHTSSGILKGDWDARNARSLADELIVRLMFDGTVARPTTTTLIYACDV